MFAFMLLLRYCGINGGRTFKRKAPFATTSFIKWGWAYFRGWAIKLQYKQTESCYVSKILDYVNILTMKIL